MTTQTPFQIASGKLGEAAGAAMTLRTELLSELTLRMGQTAGPGPRPRAFRADHTVQTIFAEHQVSLWKMVVAATARRSDPLFSDEKKAVILVEEARAVAAECEQRTHDVELWKLSGLEPEPIDDPRFSPSGARHMREAWRAIYADAEAAFVTTVKDATARV